MVASLAAEQSFVWAFCWSRAAESSNAKPSAMRSTSMMMTFRMLIAPDSLWTRVHRDTSIFSETGTSTLIVFDILIPSKLPTEIRVGIL